MSRAVRWSAVAGRWILNVKCCSRLRTAKNDVVHNSSGSVLGGESESLSLASSASMEVSSGLLMMSGGISGVDGGSGVLSDRLVLCPGASGGGSVGGEANVPVGENASISDALFLMSSGEGLRLVAAWSCQMQSVRVPIMPLLTSSADNCYADSIALAVALAVCQSLAASVAVAVVSQAARAAPAHRAGLCQCLAYRLLVRWSRCTLLVWIDMICLCRKPRGY